MSNTKPLHEYAFNVKMFAAIRVKATSEEEARATLCNTLDGASCSAGTWPDGSPILFEASAGDDEPYLYEIGGEPT